VFLFALDKTERIGISNRWLAILSIMVVLGETSVSSHDTALETLPNQVGEKPNPLERIPTAANFSRVHSVAVSGAIVATQFVQVWPYHGPQ
jgi:hypothetical protein